MLCSVHRKDTVPLKKNANQDSYGGGRSHFIDELMSDAAFFQICSRGCFPCCGGSLHAGFASRRIRCGQGCPDTAYGCWQLWRHLSHYRFQHLLRDSFLHRYANYCELMRLIVVFSRWCAGWWHTGSLWWCGKGLKNMPHWICNLVCVTCWSVVMG